MTSHRTLRTGLALLSLAASAALLPAAPAAAAPPPRADLQLTLTTTSAMITSTGARVRLVAAVDNIGAAGVEDITVAIKAPAGSRIVGDPSWSCDYSTFVCTNIYGPVAAGGSAEPLRMYLELPAAPAGTVAVLAATASTSAREATRTNNTDEAAATYAYLPDLSLLPGPDGGPWTETEVATTGGSINPTFTVRNDGTGEAAELRLAVEMPAGVTPDIAPPAGNTNWQCDLSGNLVVCTAGPLAAGGTASISIPMVAPAGTADQTFAVHGTVTTPSPQWRSDRADADVWFRYVEPPAA
ncbi:DUF11 domain-containing protein [Micromonospora sp. DR5-3]|uniref:DUF11 domain-containing protein n=1 Tax=unclassified Micromonospora TaxID=2617518 RepID=UPI0011DA0D5D|nr:MULTISPECIES: DUF11 domain-containing protein [unclassified Micromonospora]MCW3814583.1 DUF11 domain-containing protein [Micromonospora sp. DR5-3]TYC23276.1 hypothetical protein FXF52_16515 [Micromonospora sp. MP36]